MKKLWNDWSGPVAFTLGWTLLLAAALLMPNVPVWADPGGGIGEPTAPCEGDWTCDHGSGNDEKCFYKINLDRCSENGDPTWNGQGQLEDVCKVEGDPLRCGGCKCKPYRPHDGAPWSCRCE